jgi:hypothetical protein
MANKRITELSSAGALSGAELVEAVQGGVNVKTTTQAIANLAPATPGAEAFLDLTDVPGSYTGEAGKVVTVKGDESGLEFTTPGAGAFTAGSGLETTAGVTSWGSTLGTQTITDGYHNFDPLNSDLASLVFGELARLELVDFRANNLYFGGDNATNFLKSQLGGYGPGSIFSWFGVVNNHSVSGAGTLNGNVIVTQNGTSLSGVVPVLHIRRAATGSSVGSNGIGEKVVFSVKNGTVGNYSPEAGISYILTDVTNGSEDSKYILSVLVNGVETTALEITGTDVSVLGTPLLAGLNSAKVKTIQLACSDEVTPITASTNKVKFRMPYAMTVTAVRCSLSTTQTSGSIFTVDIHESGTTILSTKLTIDNGATTSVGATTPPVISDTALADDAEITIDVDQIGDATAKGLKVTIIGY